MVEQIEASKIISHSRLKPSCMYPQISFAGGGGKKPYSPLLFTFLLIMMDFSSRIFTQKTALLPLLTTSHGDRQV
jgi:hypothetical protein